MPSDVHNDRRVIGVAGCTSVGIDTSLTAGAVRPAEIVNVYVADDHRGRGVGTALADELECRLRRNGVDMLIVVSGSRNRLHGYRFWDQRYGDRFQIDADYFGPGAEAWYCANLSRIAFTIDGVDCVEIHHDKANNDVLPFATLSTPQAT